jgi:hypothetical protein
MTRSALHKIDRTGLRNKRSPLPFGGRYLAAQSEVTRCHQRDADDDAELRAVPMPADAGTRGILGEEDVLQLLGGHVRKAGSLLAKRQDEFRNSLRAAETPGVEIVVQSERHHPPFALKTLELESFKGQAGDGLNKGPLLLRSKDLLFVTEAFRKSFKREKASWATDLSITWQSLQLAHGRN